MKTPILILLAGGKSTRMGIPKGLLDYYGTPWILEQISRYKYINAPKVYIGLGYDYQKYLDKISWFKKALDSFYKYQGIDVKIVINPTPERGSFSTLQIVLKAVKRYNTSVLIQPIDVPLLNRQNLIAITRETGKTIISRCCGKNGHPVKLLPSVWKTFLSIDSRSKGARLDLQIKQLDISSITYLDMNDNSVYQNINSKKEWNAYLNKSTTNSIH